MTSNGDRIRIGTRGSELALVQSRWVAGEIARVTGDEPELVIVRTGGDKDRTSPLPSFGGTGAFTRELDEAQVRGDFEVSVHSLKDLPTKKQDGLVLGCVPVRAPVEDCLVTGTDGRSLDDLPEGARVGTGSPRRVSQLLRHRPDLQMVSIRGNVGTRVEKARGGALDAVVLAVAGLTRLGRTADVSHVIPTDIVVPAAGQGALGIVVSAGAENALAAVAGMQDPATRAAVEAERTVLSRLGAGCHMPVGALGLVEDGRLSLVARVVSLDGTRTLEVSEEGHVADAEAIGARAAERLLADGAADLLE